MTTKFELYDASKETMGVDTARMLVEHLPRADDLATKADLADLKAELAQLESRLLRRIHVLFVPLPGVYGTIVAILLKG